MKIAVYPYDSNQKNDYINRVVESILIGNPDAKITAFPQTRDIFDLHGYDYVWLNWFEDLPQKNQIKVFLSKLICLLALTVMGVKIVATLHNRQSHESKNSFFYRILFYLTFKLSYSIIILCDDSRKILSEKFGSKILKKIILVPHPTYNCKTIKSSSDIKSFKVLFFGHLRPYKNIEMIIDIARQQPEVKFTIAGKPLNTDYEHSLRSIAKQMPNVDLICHYLNEEEIDQLIDNHSILLLPYDFHSSLNSGVVIYAFCKLINVIVPAIGTINQLINRNEVFSYVYEEEKDHYAQIIKTLQKARQEFYNDYHRFHERAVKLHDEVMKSQSPHAIAPMLQKVFR